MSSNNAPFRCEVELQEGEQLRLPESLIANVGPGRWVVSIEPAAIRDHSAFLSSYAPEDEGLYDAYPSGEFWVADIPFTDRGSWSSADPGRGPSD